MPWKVQSYMHLDRIKNIMVSKEQIKRVFKRIPHILSDEAHRVTWKELPPVDEEEIKNFDRSKLNGFDRAH